MLNKTLAVSLAMLALAACAQKKQGEVRAVTKQSYGTTLKGEPVDLFTLKNKNGVEIAITNYGGIITSLKVPDAKGAFGDIVLGFDDLGGYLKPNPYFGAIIGRYGNRIAGGKFTLDGKTYSLDINNGPNSLHGGNEGFDKRVWTAKEFEKPGEVGVELTYLSKDGEGGYPGNLQVTVHYILTDANALKIHYKATTDKDTVVNLTNHSYFNLKGAGNGDILDHELALNAAKFMPTNKDLIPTGELRPVKGTPFDFLTPHVIGSRIHDDYEQLKLAGGYDHNFVIQNDDPGMVLSAKASDPTSGRTLEVWTTEPGVQFYTGNFLDGTVIGRGGKVYKKNYGFCLETQHYPDSPNHPDFPSTVLKPSQQYESTTVWKFGTVKKP
jgi:aldose 1-epimerase